MFFCGLTDSPILLHCLNKDNKHDTDYVQNSVAEMDFVTDVKRS